ncbi:hypothetical protein LHJ73_21675 [Mycolicibacterium phocaicum]|nr:hypothetical protein LHJ73_21675 [Mycolicibacterium phocaicum]
MNHHHEESHDDVVHHVRGLDRCATKVASALDPTDYAITFDGETISLSPSIGNWNFHCRSHYVIRRGQVRWMPAMSDADIAAGRHRDRRAKTARDELFDAPTPPRVTPENDTTPVGGHGHIRQRVTVAIKGLIATIRGR